MSGVGPGRSSHHSSGTSRAYLGGSHASRGSMMHQHRSSAAAISDPMITMTDQLASASGPLSGSSSALNQLGAAGYYPAPTAGYDYYPAAGRESRYDAHYSGRSSGRHQPPLDPYYPTGRPDQHQHHQSLGNLHSGGRYAGDYLAAGPERMPMGPVGHASASGRYLAGGEASMMAYERTGSMPPQLDSVGLGAYNPLEDPLAVNPLVGQPGAPVYPQQASGYGPGPAVGRADALVAELRARLQETQNNYVLVKRELETATQKLGSSMHSIKSFWSPELKKERAMRKEEATKYALINDQMKLMRVEVQVSSGWSGE